MVEHKKPAKSHLSKIQFLYEQAAEEIGNGAIATLLDDRKPHHQIEIACQLELPVPLVRDELLRLVQRGLIEEVGYCTYQAH